ncbi:SAM-dependent methyltransferase [Streptomyces sp. NPDC091279]|uniref:SAM-dependent methyltransferase n=1 Tax=unclassified Streptomyces TaxID=2593676 RepID=UPI0037FD7032
MSLNSTGIPVPADPASSERVSADIFNSALAAAGISAAWSIGALDALRDAGRLDVADFAERHDLDHPALREVFASLAHVGVVVRDGDAVTPGPHFAAVDRDKGFFYWLTRGYGELFSELPKLLHNGNRTGQFYRRDGAAIGVACRENNRVFFDPTFTPVIEKLEFSAVADLGCGSGERLIDIARNRPGVRGIGVDLSESVLELAGREVAEAGLSDRVTLVRSNATELDASPEFVGVDLVTSFMMAHDFWPREACVASFKRIRECFPDVKHFLLADTARVTGVPDGQLPVFSLGFEMAHAVMGVYLPTLDEWDDVFAESGWRCADRHLIDTPANSYMFHLVPN